VQTARYSRMEMRMSNRPMTAIHVTHEGIDHMGGIGTVLEGLLTSAAYQRAVGRSIFVGPLPFADHRVARPIERLGEFAATCRYSGPEHYDPEGFGAILKPIEWAFGVRMVYGTRTFREKSAGGLDGREVSCEVLLIDVTNPDPERLGAFKWFLFDKYGVDSRRYESGWDFEEWCRLADPAYHALCALLGRAAVPGGGDGPAMVFSHEFMGMCTALRCLADRQRFRVLFHAHECSTARRIVEHLPGHDVAFYPAMRNAAGQGRSVEELFGDQSDFSRHALVSKTHLLDGVLAVGPETAEELRFLSPAMREGPVRTAFNGLPAPRVTMDDKRRSRGLVDQWLRRVLGFVPDYLITHVTRPVVSKGLWRDAKLARHLAPLLKREGKTAAYMLLTCGAVPRSGEQATRMHTEYGWPLHHREGYPDLDGVEVGLHRQLLSTFRHHGAHAVRSAEAPVHALAGGQVGGEESVGAEPSVVTPMLVNQFGFSRDRLGDAAPEGISIDDLRRAADAELGMSVYEPYGIAHLEAMHAGAICLPSTVCGCLGLVRRAMVQLGIDERTCPVVLPVDFTLANVTDPARFTSHERDAFEERVCEQAATELAARLPRSDADRARLLDLGQRLAQRMSWDSVCESDILPAMADAGRRG
ncbi:MAG: hypothetical protein ACT4PL_13245, partial [Phycisphaerales bacterium]